MKTERIWAVCVALAAVLTAAGCGGGGGGTAGGRGTLRVFVTDGFREDFSQVWVTLHKIEVGDDRGFHTVFDDSTGKTINVAALSSSSQMVGSAGVPAGTFTQARVTIEDHMKLVHSGGGGTDDTQVDDSTTPTAGGLSAVTLPISQSVGSGQSGSLVIDFDLANFEIRGGKVRPHLRHADDGQFQLRDKRAELTGTVSNFVAGTGFDLTLANSSSVHVILTANTAIFTRSNGAAGALSSGIPVEVKGAFDTSTQTVTADSVKIEDHINGDDHGQHVEGANAEGTVASVDATAKSFVLTLEEAEHFTPPAGTITVVTTSSTIFARRHGGAATFADVVGGVKLEATGTFDAAANTLTAVRVELR